jgi:hypothetical protein
MYTGCPSRDSFIAEWIKKTEAFLELAFDKAKGVCTTWCPYSNYANTRRQTKEAMETHLAKYKFTADYTRWVYHGELIV